MTGAERHVRQDVALDVQPRRHLEQLDALCMQSEHAAFGDVEHRLAAPEGLAAGEGAVLDLTHELRLAIGA